MSALVAVAGSGATGSRLLKGRLFPKCASAQWELVLAQGDDHLTVQAPWLTLAWMGHLAGWPEP